jgi:hypothetical protein
MKSKIYNVEDSLELLVGLKDQASFQIESSDQTILQSIGRQVFKGTALTDRQHELVKEKLLKYKDQFTALEYDLDSALENLRMPLREIDRSKYIALVDTIDVYKNTPYESHKQDYNWIKVRFPFTKKLILLVESLNHDGQYHHQKGSHEHYYRASEKNIYEVLSTFGDKNFEIDNDLKIQYEKLVEMKNNEKNYIPGIYNFKLENLSSRAIEYMISSIGEPDTNTLAIYKDRQEQFGLKHFDEYELENSLNNLSVLGKKIANRKKFQIFINSNEYKFSALADAILELYRMPLLVVLPASDPLQSLYTVHQTFKNVVDIDSSTVMFRLSNDEQGKDFNSYVKDYSLNNPLDKYTKIVYTDSNKISKPLVKSDWRPSAVLLMSSHRPNTKVMNFIESSDLIIHYDTEQSRFLMRELEVIK